MNRPNIEWLHLEEMGQIDEILTASQSRTQMIFKHSTRCGVSGMVRSQLDGNWTHAGKITPWHLDLLRNRNISNEVAERFGVQHESPQIILISKGQVTKAVSHTPLSKDELDAST